MKLTHSLGLAAAATTVFGLSVALRAQGQNDAPPTPSSQAQPASVEAGALAPDFALPDQAGTIHRLADYKGKTLVLAFYPADMTAGCTLEAHSLTNALNDFNKRGISVVGVSVQDVASKKKFCELEGIKYPLLADTEKQVSRAYGVLGGSGVAKRVTFIINPSGTIAAVDRKVNVTSHAQDLLAVLDRMSADKPKSADANAKVSIDQAVAPFTLSSVLGKPVSVGDWATNKATVVIFMSARCPVSNGYNTRMEALAKTYTARGVRFFGINANQTEAVPEIAAHARQHGFTFAVLKDTGNPIADRFDANVTPESYVIDAKGILRYHGRIDDSQNPANVTQHNLQNALDAVLAGKPVAVKEAPAFGCSIKRVEK